VPATAEVYHDRLIEPDAAGEFAAGAWDLEDAEPEGRRFYSVEYQHYQQDYIDSASEDGLLFNWRRETLNYGDLSLDAAIRNGGDETITRNDRSG